MRSWGDVATVIVQKGLPYKVIRWNMSLRGCLVETVTDQVVAVTVKDSAKLIKRNCLAKS